MRPVAVRFNSSLVNPRRNWGIAELMSKLIFGCGYLGGRVARLWQEAGHAVHVVTRCDRRAGELAAAGYRPIVDAVAANS